MSVTKYDLYRGTKKELINFFNNDFDLVPYKEHGKEGTKTIFGEDNTVEKQINDMEDGGLGMFFYLTYNKSEENIDMIVEVKAVFCKVVPENKETK